MNKKYFSILCLFLATCSAFGQLSAPKYANEFLSIGVGGRGLAMGNVQTAIANDVTAGYWNPAGLLEQTNQHNVALMHSELFAGIAKNDFAAYSTPIDSSSVVGVSVIRVGVDNIANTLRLKENGVIDYNNITTFGVADYAFLFSYAKRSNLIPGLKLGGNAKVIYRNIGPFGNGWGLGMDVGAQFERKGWKIGLMVSDVTTTVTAWTYNTELLEETFLLTNNELPDNSTEIVLPRVNFGIAREWVFNDRWTLLQSLEASMTTDGRRNTLLRTGVVSIDPRWGMEFGYKGFLFARTGINNIQQLQDFDESKYWVLQPNVGVGFKVSSFSVDYALVKISTGDSGLFSHIFSLKLNFDDLPKF